MRLINELFYCFPELDLADLRILIQVGATPGLSIKDLAELLALDQRQAQEKIARLGGGRKRRRGSAYGLIDSEYNLADGRMRSLALTDAGAEFVKKLGDLKGGGQRK